ncbi:uncharacterized protein C17orf67 homolog [Lepisosteus oculatus]|uniref:uncharacterized protein C17orf67 homolog n=1 Tax=Lepisosteus oculatus TaxID=7918 RepID=UPI003715095F
MCRLVPGTSRSRPRCCQLRARPVRGAGDVSIYWSRSPRGSRSELQQQRAGTPLDMKTLVALVLALVLLTSCTDASPILKENIAKQLLRSKRQDRPRKAGFPDEPNREHMLYLQRLEQRARETDLEHWLNPHCFPRCDRNYVHPV